MKYLLTTFILTLLYAAQVYATGNDEDGSASGADGGAAITSGSNMVGK